MMGVAQAITTITTKRLFIGATVLTHPINKGKGAALKTAFAHIQEEVVSQHLSAQPIVTVDSDGQHLIKDIVRVAKAIEENPSHLVLGARAFVGKVPARSRFGNKVTAGLFPSSNRPKGNRYSDGSSRHVHRSDSMAS